MTEYQGLKRYSIGTGCPLAGALFFFAIIGVFGLKITIGSLVLFAILAPASTATTEEQMG
jgi:threonine/homoserine efflux transporter RhtA